MSTAQRYAHAAVRDGLTEDTINALASLASFGHNPANAERDFHRWMPYAYGSNLECHYIVIDALNPDTGRPSPTKIPVLLPCDVLSSMWSTAGQAAWNGCIGGTPEKCKEYWDYAASSWASSHPVVVKGIQEKALPVHILAVHRFANVGGLKAVKSSYNSIMKMPPLSKSQPTSKAELHSPQQLILYTANPQRRPAANLASV